MRKQAVGMLLLVAALAACGGGSDKTGAAGPTNESSKTPTTTAPQAAGGDCDYATKFNESASALGSQTQGTDAASIKKQMLAARDAMDEAAAAAPGEIRPDVTKLMEFYGKMIDALEKYDFDYTKIPPAEIGNVFSFAQSTDYLEVAKRVGKYFAEKCGMPDPFASVGG